jgi:hypothetical protein
MSSADEFFDDLRRRTVVGRSAKQKAALGSVVSPKRCTPPRI